jgi:hypothetical protein
VVAHPAEDASHAAAAASSRCRLHPCPPRSRPRRALRTPAWPAWSLSGTRGRRGPHPTRPARVRHRPPSLTDATWQRRPHPGRLDHCRAVDGPGSHRGLHRFWWPRSPDQLDLGSQRHRLRWETDASGRTGQTADGRPPDPLDDHPR